MSLHHIATRRPVTHKKVLPRGDVPKFKDGYERETVAFCVCFKQKRIGIVNNSVGIVNNSVGIVNNSVGLNRSSFVVSVSSEHKR